MTSEILTYTQWCHGGGFNTLLASLNAHNDKRAISQGSLYPLARIPEPFAAIYSAHTCFNKGPIGKGPLSAKHRFTLEERLYCAELHEYTAKPQELACPLHKQHTSCVVGLTMLYRQLHSLFQSTHIPRHPDTNPTSPNSQRNPWKANL